MSNLLVASLRPDAFGPTRYDLLRRLNHHIDEHTGGDKPFPIYRPPESLRISLDRVMARVTSVGSPGLGATVDACIYYGLPVLQASDEVQTMIETRRRLALLDVDDVDGIEEIYSLLSSSTISLPSLTTRQAKKLQAKITEPRKAQALALSESIGTPTYVVVQIATMIALTHQPRGVILAPHKAQFEEIIRLFLVRIFYRRRMAEALIESVEVAKTR